MKFVTPNSEGREEIDQAFLEMNDCHSPDDGKFCSGPNRSTIRRFDRQLWKKGEKRPSQGEMRDLEKGGLATQHPDHSFTLNDAGRAVLADERRAVAPKPKKERFADKIMNQMFDYGGVQTSRANVIRDLTKQGLSQQHIDRYMQGLEISQGMKDWKSASASMPKKTRVAKVETFPDRVKKMPDQDLRSAHAAAQFNTLKTSINKYSNMHRQNERKEQVLGDELRTRARAKRRQRSTSSRFL